MGSTNSTGVPGGYVLVGASGLMNRCSVRVLLFSQEVRGQGSSTPGPRGDSVDQLPAGGGVVPPVQGGPEGPGPGAVRAARRPPFAPPGAGRNGEKETHGLSSGRAHAHRPLLPAPSRIGAHQSRRTGRRRRGRPRQRDEPGGDDAVARSAARHPDLTRPTGEPVDGVAQNRGQLRRQDHQDRRESYIR